MKLIRILLCLGAVALIAAGCGSVKVHNQAQQVASNPQVQQVQTQDEALVNGCMKKANLFTHSGRHAFVLCLAPGGTAATEAQIEKCVEGKVSSIGFYTSADRKRLIPAIATCIR